MTLVRWRVALGRGGGQSAPTGTTGVDPRSAQRIATISYVQGAIVAVMVLAAVAMARGYGARG
jgi:hypothetical protein